jgi:hypothetical protein
MNEAARIEWNGKWKPSAWSSQRIRVGEDGVRRTWRWCCMAGAAAWPRVASAVTRQPTRSVKRPVPLTCGPSGLFKLICFLPMLQL